MKVSVNAAATFLPHRAKPRSQTFKASIFLTQIIRRFTIILGPLIRTNIVREKVLISYLPKACSNKGEGRREGGGSRPSLSKDDVCPVRICVTGDSGSERTRPSSYPIVNVRVGGERGQWRTIVCPRSSDPFYMAIVTI